MRPAGTSASPSSARSAASPTGSSRRIAALACSWVLVACAGASDPAPLPPEPEDRSSAPGWLPEPRRYHVGQRWTEEVTFSVEMGMWTGGGTESRRATRLIEAVLDVEVESVGDTSELRSVVVAGRTLVVDGDPVDLAGIGPIHVTVGMPGSLAFDATVPPDIQELLGMVITPDLVQSNNISREPGPLGSEWPIDPTEEPRRLGGSSCPSLPEDIHGQRTVESVVERGVPATLVVSTGAASHCGRRTPSASLTDVGLEWSWRTVVPTDATRPALVVERTIEWREEILWEGPPPDLATAIATSTLRIERTPN